MKLNIYDGLRSLVSSFANDRNVVNTNEIVAPRVTDNELRAIYKTGLGSKIIRIKNGYALKNTIEFADKSEGEYYKKNHQMAVKKAGLFMLGFGRGVILINERDATDHSKPLTGIPSRYKLDVFSGDMVTAQDVSLNLSSDRYNRPTMYNVRGYPFHYSRVVDFRYVEPPELDLPLYKYGGISEFALIYNQMIGDGIVERAGSAIVEKNSSLFYKVKGFKQALQSNQESKIKEFYGLTEKMRSIFGATLIDAADDAFSVDQSLANLDAVDQITLRRLAMVTSIPLAILVGESVRGMNSTGETEKLVFNEMIETLEEDYYLNPINELNDKTGRQPIKFSDTQNITATEKIDYETKAIENALKLHAMGGDAEQYLIDRSILYKDDFAIFNEE